MQYEDTLNMGKNYLKLVKLKYKSIQANWLAKKTCLSSFFISADIQPSEKKHVY